ncbi:MAG TPA: hypothetical protein VM182_13405 [Terriglobia bacterium]|nr:hypothetical protein [Terriglobia bacterium]
MRNADVFEACLEAYRRYMAVVGSVTGRSRLTSAPRERSPWRGRPREADFIADFALVARAALFKEWLAAGQMRRSKGPVRVFNLYYVKRQGHDYEEARAELRCSPMAFEGWDRHVRRVAGGAFRRAGLWPLRQYFRRPMAEGQIRCEAPSVETRLDNGFAVLGAAYTEEGNERR